LRLEKAGQIEPGLTLYGLRHTVAVILRECGFDERTIADPVEMARHYARGADLRLANGARGLDVHNHPKLHIDEIVIGVGEKGRSAHRPRPWAAGSDGETNFGVTSLAAPKAASSSVARYSFTARLAPLAARSLFHSAPGIERCLLASATIRLASTANPSPPTSPAAMHVSTTSSKTRRKISLSRNRSLRARENAERSETLSSIESPQNPAIGKVHLHIPAKPAWCRALIQLMAQIVTIVGVVAKHALWRLYSADQPLGNRIVVRFACCQQDGNEASFSICECVYLRVAPSARAANSLFLLPPFPPAAERCASTCVESIICVSADRPLPARCRNRFFQIPRSAQRTKRL